MPDQPGFAARVVELGEELRGEGVQVGTSALLDAFAALEQVGWTDPDVFREALAATLAKSPEDRRVFELVFERFFFRAAEAAAAEEGVREQDDANAGLELGDAAGGVDLATLRQQIAAALRDGEESQMRDLARLAIAAFGRQGEGSGVIGVDVQRIRRALGLRSEPQPDLPVDDPRRDGVPRDRLRRFEQLLRRELERRQIERLQALPPKRPLNELDRALPTGPLQDLASVHRVVAQLKRRLKTQGQEHRGTKRRMHVDVRRTMRASLEHRRRPGRRQGEADAAAAAGDLRALRRVDVGDERVGVLPQRAARAARRVPQDALVRVHRARQRGDRRLRPRARLPRGERRRSAATPASPTSRATPTTAACGASSSSRWRTTCTRGRR